MKPTIRKTNRQKAWILSIAALFLSIILFRIFIYSPTETLSVKAVRVSGGWGYQVYIHQKLFIDQPFIPALPGKKPFPDKGSALRAAKTVKAKLLNGQRPMLTPEDISNAGLDSLGNLKSSQP